MPHICTRCNSVFELGEDILKGCPACGWKKFMFCKTTRESDRSGNSEEQIITRAMGVRVPPRRMERELATDEKAMPRSQIQAPISPIPTIGSKPTPISTKSEEAKESESNPGNGETLESIKITAPGTYELNLPTLFERDELIMAVKEGTYFIDLTSAFKKSKKD